MFGKKKYKVIRTKKNIHEITLKKYKDSDTYIPSGQKNIVNHLSKSSFTIVGIILIFFLLFLLYKTMVLQVYTYDTYKKISENNSFTRDITFANRGFILDRNGEQLAWNEPGDEVWGTRGTLGEGFGHILGYVSYPEKDSSGNFFRVTTEGKEGVEKIKDEVLQGKNGSTVIERDAQQHIVAERFIEKPTDGNNIQLSIDKDIQEILYESIKTGVQTREFNAGSGAIIDIQTGEIYALTSYPDYNTQAFNRRDSEAIETYLTNDRKPLFNRAISGLYPPGSTVKPFIGVALLEEGIVDQHTSFESTGQLVIENKFDPENPSIFLDNKVHGIVNITDAIAVSSNVFFYIAGGGYKSKQGLGIRKIEEYTDYFHLTRPTKIGFLNEPEGVVPSPEWKREIFEDEWYVGDTYNTVIGQYGFSLTPMQILRGIAALANDGVLVEPTIFKIDPENIEEKVLPFSKKSLSIVQKAMRETTLRGTATALNKYPLAVKTGTSQIGNKRINSLISGFYPYHDPQFAFIVVLENGPETLRGRGGAVATAQLLFNTLENK